MCCPSWEMHSSMRCAKLQWTRCINAAFPSIPAHASMMRCLRWFVPLIFHWINLRLQHTPEEVIKGVQICQACCPLHRATSSNPVWEIIIQPFPHHSGVCFQTLWPPCNQAVDESLVGGYELRCAKEGLCMTEDAQSTSGFGGEWWHVVFQREILAESEAQEFEWLKLFQPVVEKVGGGRVCGTV